VAKVYCYFRHIDNTTHVPHCTGYACGCLLAPHSVEGTASSSTQAVYCTCVSLCSCHTWPRSVTRRSLIGSAMSTQCMRLAMYKFHFCVSVTAQTLVTLWLSIYVYLLQPIYLSVYRLYMCGECRYLRHLFLTTHVFLYRSGFLKYTHDLSPWLSMQYIKFVT
jgi:hypothetical protein